MSNKNAPIIETVTLAVLREFFNAYYLGAGKTAQLLTKTRVPIAELDPFLQLLNQHGFTLGSDHIVLADKHGLYWFRKQAQIEAGQKRLTAKQTGE